MRLRWVHGIEGLLVCDASVMPVIPCANLNVPILMSADGIRLCPNGEWSRWRLPSGSSSFRKSPWKVLRTWR